jgi:hypothetical protein
VHEGEALEEIGQPPLATEPALNLSQELTRLQKQIDALKNAVQELSQKKASESSFQQPTFAATTSEPVQSGYIATNGKELAALKRLGEWNYFEFTLAKSKIPQKVGDISLLLKRTDAELNIFTIEIAADDKVTEKKDRKINEPIQFYLTTSHQPYEIVVNEVRQSVNQGLSGQSQRSEPLGINLFRLCVLVTRQ